jgi:thymidylate synthase ThyX
MVLIILLPSLLTCKMFSSIFQIMVKRQVYLLSPKELNPETIAVAFAKTSRSPESFRKIASELNEETSTNFHERWVVGYGHASVAEHAVLHIAIENVSRLAVECIEANRLASYTEKSTRYQRWDADSFIIPSELDGHPLRKTYIQTCKMLFKTYGRCIASVRKFVESQHPRQKNETEEVYKKLIHPLYADSCRFLLPVASLANLGMTANARVLEHAISKMLSHPLVEVRQIGEEVKNTALTEIPTLVKYAQPLPYLTNTCSAIQQQLIKGYREQIEKQSEISNEWCQLIDFDPDGERKILAAALYRFGEMPYGCALEAVLLLPESEKVKLAKLILGKLGEHDTPLRELEYTTYTFDLILDEGAYAEFKRHRMMTQTPQSLTTRLGVALPMAIVEAGFEIPYISAMEKVSEIYEELAKWNPFVASYIVPNGFNRRVLFTMNLREAFAFCQLRSSSNAHFSMRRVAQRLAEEIKRVHPLLLDYLHLPEESWQEIEKKNFKSEQSDPTTLTD